MKLLHTNVTVLEVEDLEDDDGTPLHGQWSHDPGEGPTIRVANLNDKATILHEMIHGISELLGLNLSEKATRGLEVGLYLALQENPEFFRGILGAADVGTKTWPS